jgi:hypothetical protein
MRTLTGSRTAPPPELDVFEDDNHDGHGDLHEGS